MQIEWKSQDVSPYLSLSSAEWPGVRVRRANVLAGRMLEHVSDTHEISVAIAGTITTRKLGATGKCVTTVGPMGNICLTPAGQAMSASWDAPIDNLGLFLNTDLVSGIAIENGFSPDVEFVEVYRRSDSLIQSLGLSLLDSSNAENSLGRLYSDSLVQTLTLHLLTNYTTVNTVPVLISGGLSGYKLRRVKEFIDAHLEDDLSLGEIAAVAELSPFHFSRAFRRSMGKTPHQYLMQQRVERAKELLARPDLPIVEVGLRTGFKNQSHFTTLFRKYTRFTPKLWRELKLA